MRGIGPAYVDKMARCGIRVGDLLNEAVLKEKIELNVEEKNIFLAHFGAPLIDSEKTFSEYAVYAEEIRGYIKDVSFFLNERLKAGQSVLFEGAQGALLDIDHGTYPFVTTSNSTIGGVCTGLGISPNKIDAVIGIAKAYTTRVGSGALPTEIHDEWGEYIREKGKEFGATTGRPRRCGWFDAVACRYTARLSGVSDVALMHLDTLSGLDPIGVCVAYRIGSAKVKAPPANADLLEQAEPVLEFLPGWQEDLRSVRRFEDLPAAA